MRKLIFVAIVMCLLAPACLAATRQVVSFDQGWKYHRGEVANASAMKFAESEWEAISLPHTWNTDHDPPQAGYYRGPGWYRKTFDAPRQWRGRRVFIRFGAASLVAQVFLNGQELGEHRGGFAAFVFELTPHLRFGAHNVLAVRVDNSHREDVVPLGGDFTVFGGLYRSAELIVTGPACITPLDHGSPGVFIRQQNVSDASADVEVTAEVSNETASKKEFEVRVTVRDAQREVASSSRGRLNVAPGETQPVTERLSISHPHLWNGTADPYLYSVDVELLDHGKTIDLVEQPLGLRYFRFDPQQGFFLNGKHLELHGVDRHQDFAEVGWAIGTKEQDIDMRLMREMGVNAVRLAHYQHAQYFYDLCDRNGLVVWAELPMVDWVRDSDAFRENVRQQLTELIRQNLNHPSILMWSLYNEPSPTNTVDVAAVVAGLKDLAKQEDPTRPTTGALSIDGIEKLHAVGELNDLLALNVYPGWYIESPADMGPILDKWNAAYGSRGIIVSEYGAGASIHQHQQDFAVRSGRVPNNWHPEEWQSIVHEENYRQIHQRPFVFGSFVWNMFDFASAGRKEGDTFGINDKGLVTRDRRVRKDAYFFYQANWTDAPMVYITSRRDVERSTPETPVKVLSNCASVSLTVNGKSYDAAAPNDLHVFRWEHVPLAEGANHVEAVANCGSRTVRDDVTWQYRAKQP
ncbi:MAG: glycoside hydrolase family 2 TIM barrel-domain containing protein [Terriglobales bacterium]